jgi:hypothetical protein
LEWSRNRPTEVFHRRFRRGTAGFFQNDRLVMARRAPTHDQNAMKMVRQTTQSIRMGIPWREFPFLLCNAADIRGSGDVGVQAFSSAKAIVAELLY